MPILPIVRAAVTIAAEFVIGWLLADKIIHVVRKRRERKTKTKRKSRRTS